jgi:serine/threonine protein kinase
MHAYGIVHRDLKLQNVMMTDKHNGSPKLVDFGFAKIVGPSEHLIDHYGS